jgi:hypothetical protein
MAGINAVVQLTDSQKQQVLGVLAERAAEKVEQEADARAFMSLAYGGLAADMDAPHVRGLSNLLNMSPAQDPNLEFGSAEYQQWIEEQKSERIENELSALRGVLNDDQLARYREHLEAEPPR